MSPPLKRPKRTKHTLYTPARVFSHTSPMIAADLTSFLASCISSWSDAYTEEEKRTLIDSFPPAYRLYSLEDSGKLKCPLTVEFVKEDTNLKEAASRFKKDIADGYYEAQWQNQAKKAMQERSEGKYDEYIRDCIEDDFGEVAHDKEDSSEDEDSDWTKEKNKTKFDDKRSRIAIGPTRTSMRTRRARGLREEVIAAHLAEGEELGAELEDD